MNKQKKNLIITVILFIVAVVYTLLVKYVDQAPISPGGEMVGFSTLNEKFHILTGLNLTWYNITKYLGIIPFLLVLYFGLIGLRQLINRKKILKVDRKLLLLGCFYILLGITYVFFEKVIINYRPVILDGELEASYPSSHTMLAICICLSSIMISKDYIKNKKYKNIFDKVCWVLLLLLVVGRTLSGVHWLSDILGGIIISLFLVSLYNTLIIKCDKKT